MPKYRHILDNQSGTVADFLERSLEEAAAFDLVSAYFSIYGYQRLADQLDGVGRVRFLFGEPSSADDPDPGGKASRISPSPAEIRSSRFAGAVDLVTWLRFNH